MADNNQLILAHPYFEVDNPQHFINLVPDAIKHAAYQIPYEWLEWDEAQIIVKVYNGNVPDTDAIYRLNFWESYYSKFEKEKPLTLSDIVGSTGAAYLKKSILTDPGRTLYLITEPTKINSATKYTHHLAMKSMIETLKLPVMYNSKTGLPDTQLLQVKNKIFEYIDQRLHGSIIQRQETKSMNQNINVAIDATKEKEMAASNNMEALDAKIKQLEAELAQSPAPLPPAMEQLPVETSMENVRTVMPLSIKLRDE